MKEAERKRGREDYLRTIYELSEDENIGVKSIDIASALAISKASVSEMLRKLAKENLIKMQPYSKIFLTAKGKKQAENVFDKNYTISKFLKKFLEHDEFLAEKEAHELEHAFSEESLEKINKIMFGKKENKEIAAKSENPSYVG